MPICPDAIHKQLDLAMDDIKKQFSIQYYTLPGLHKLTLEPCGDWFPEEQKPIRFKLQAPSYKPQASSIKLQAASPKHRVSSLKPQAASVKILAPENVL